MQVRNFSGQDHKTTYIYIYQLFRRVNRLCAIKQNAKNVSINFLNKL